MSGALWALGTRLMSHVRLPYLLRPSTDSSLDPQWAECVSESELWSGGKGHGHVPVLVLIRFDRQGLGQYWRLEKHFRIKVNQVNE